MTAMGRSYFWDGSSESEPSRGPQERQEQTLTCRTCPTASVTVHQPYKHRNHVHCHRVQVLHRRDHDSN
ncbi:Hypothetical protein NTJ_07054 [Nesidiocoris tenuis]|nr:Hypothetical protein NTJ_07054 [Nesidiocoris tenuis]